MKNMKKNMKMIIRNLNKKLKTKIIIEWNCDYRCYVAKTKNNNLIGCGDSPIEALQHLVNHIKDEEETPLAKTKQKTKGE
jgi:hypothetical protein